MEGKASKAEAGASEPKVVFEGKNTFFLSEAGKRPTSTGECSGHKGILACPCHLLAVKAPLV
jgi:hypothetical protein